MDAQIRAKRIHIGHEYHSYAKTVGDAQRINAHIRSRRLAFIQGQSERAEVEGVAPR